MSLKNLINLSLKEDIGRKDITTDCLISRRINVRAEIIAKESGILAGVEAAGSIFKAVDKNLSYKKLAKDGDMLKRGKQVAIICGKARSILKGERAALNIISRLSGIASFTKKFTARISGTQAKIYDTRKTSPGLRELEKHAVKCGGGVNHRIRLDDQVLIKDNHIKVISNQSPATRLKELIIKARKKVGKNIKIEIEVKNLKELKQALAGKPDIIMLDNFKLNQIKKAMKTITQYDIRHTKYAPLIEVSGSVNLNNVRAIAKAGVERISVGAITHSAPALDFSLDILDK